MPSSRWETNLFGSVEVVGDPYAGAFLAVHVLDGTGHGVRQLFCRVESVGRAGQWLELSIPQALFAWVVDLKDEDSE
ncbi:hypothetical protein Aaci_0487 [Alicyclobacillus acidocaldarius subsp. acidocaldarius DSM 446]|uniref:Uncharacterized protein n=1 Tax=Alicyclobacillus acidocaldarius subsp. acidocaldarius (strain ATCC 27009 / DSM 446 / BCRC 14685 / JCM 5260 / KCTC 1825 / NBRC 15652 / NCIMB 11725 / NRRL B-14509 / 104-IA) TaxID=521098 RepID=C8WSN9_ALIAD|nr:hypothetical protein Aaci_0487 [Alicyclobacillus acidocaldarius subsp. acidocaldarius DSM 446]